MIGIRSTQKDNLNWDFEPSRLIFPREEQTPKGDRGEELFSLGG